jgi:predicted dehydrogenase
LDDHLGVGILGSGWITRAHGHAIRTLGHIAPLARPVRLTALAARADGSRAKRWVDRLVDATASFLWAHRDTLSLAVTRG